VLRTHGIEWDKNIDFVVTGDGGRGVPVGTDDIFLTTSWWSTARTLRSVNPNRIIYLLQEDERMFYPHGDEWLRCSEILADADIRIVVNSRLLYEHLTADGFGNLKTNAVWFEPAFPESVYFREERGRVERRRFLFYARPNNLRNLFVRGVQAIAAAVEQELFSENDWDFYFAGKDIPPIMLPGNIKPVRLQNLPWPEYGALVRSMDIGLSLMCTPHPSYPPLDLASSGAVVVTNTFSRKVSLSNYSNNIICAEPTVDGLVNGLKAAVELVVDEPRRENNYARNRIVRDWHTSFRPVLDWLMEN
jgi:hypothetical protein